ncbi:OmpA family protein [Streptosporangium sp. NBC_01755]|uniref:OmpA family protein n=1 Tax=unclassified Streptosporangium TaxID=2632669 RepID=UPI002DDA30E5|nr:MULTISPECIES: OmpA family protein [unclassified Streptosporangium]WSA27043.1 OmpA family protein [Streptosporangium sp. NBC_01810]WSD01547.1 OmpA family protein [Streptosporangium sp. NBC_01755]
MSRSPERLAVLALTFTLVVAPAVVAWADPEDTAADVEDIVAPVEDIIAEVESLDGAESESKRGEQVTVALTSDVLFALDRAVLTPQARQRLRRVAERIQAESAGGVVRIEGHTDDQGADAYNDALSLRRARAVQQALRQQVSHVTFQAMGFGERRPKLPNVVQGRPVKENQAKNRRVEIVFNAKR